MARILVVDDSDVVRTLIREWLTEEGHEIVGEAENGKIAVEKFKELRPDITTLDINMPYMTGIDALCEIMEIDKAANVLMVSAEGGKDSNIPKSLLQGACEFIEKPFEKELFVNTIEHIVQRLQE